MRFEDQLMIIMDIYPSPVKALKRFPKLQLRPEAKDEEILDDL